MAGHFTEHVNNNAPRKTWEKVLSGKRASGDWREEATAPKRYKAGTGSQFLDRGTPDTPLMLRMAVPLNFAHGQLTLQLTIHVRSAKL